VLLTDNVKDMARNPMASQGVRVSRMSEAMGINPVK